MKKSVLFLVLSFGLGINQNAQAQSNWAVGGNDLTTVGRIGSNNNLTVAFETNNQEQGRVTNLGLWGFGTARPNAKVQINSVAGQNPLRVQVNTLTKLIVHNNGGTAIGVNSIPPINGLHVNGSTGFGTAFPAAKVQVNYNSRGLNPTLMLFENEYDYARLNFGNTSTGNVFAVAGLPAATNEDARLNFYYSGLGDIMTIRGDGKVGIKTSAPQVEAHISHGSGSGATNGLRLTNAAINKEDWTFYVLNNGGDLELYANDTFSGSFDDVSGVYTAISDLKRKKDVEKAEAVLPKVLQLGVKKYHFLKNTTADKKYYGLIAQEVEKYFPELVHQKKGDDGNEVYTMDYSAFGILAIKAIQEQQQTIATLEERIAKLEAALGTNSPATSNNPDILGVSLEQNQPNPFNQTTTFRYTLPAGASGQIKIYDATSGTLVKTLAAPASGQVQVSAYDLKAGTYVYTLQVNGKLAASKQMLIVQ